MSKQKLSIGRGAANGIVIDDKTVSRQHAEIVFVGPGKYRIVDNDSANGTYVQIDNAFHRASEAEVDDDDVVRFGDYQITVGALVDRALDGATTKGRRSAGDQTTPVPPSVDPVDPLKVVKPTEPAEPARKPAPAPKPAPPAAAPKPPPPAPPPAPPLPAQEKPPAPPPAPSPAASPAVPQAAAATAAPKQKKKIGEGVMVLIGLGVTALLVGLFYLVSLVD